jgi:primosomal protein N' (replication factor Y) (superfamily II helicase)
VRVAVEALADRPERTFTYLLPAALGEARPGALVLVPYGRRLALGYVLPGEDDDAGGELRDVEAIVSEPMLTPDLLELAEAISAYYRAPIGTTLAAMLPPGLESRLVRRWEVVRPDELPGELSALADAGGWIADAALQRHAPKGARAAWVDRLRRGGIIRADWSLRAPEVAERRVRVLRAIPGDAEPPRRAPVQRALLEALGEGERTMPELAEALDAEPSSLLGPARRLVALGRAELDWRTVERDPLAHRPSRASCAMPWRPSRSRPWTPSPRSPRAASCCSRGSPPPARPMSTSPRCGRRSMPVAPRSCSFRR